jgi:hypothetical protein
VYLKRAGHPDDERVEEGCLDAALRVYVLNLHTVQGLVFRV